MKKFANKEILKGVCVRKNSIYWNTDHYFQFFIATSKLENEARANTTTNAINVRMSVAWHQRWKLVFWTGPEPEVDVSFYANTMLPCPWVPIKGLYVERYLKIQKFNEINTKYISINFSIFLGRGAVMGWRQRGYIVCFTLISMLKWITMFTLKNVWLTSVTDGFAAPPSPPTHTIDSSVCLPVTLIFYISNLTTIIADMIPPCWMERIHCNQKFYLILVML